MSEPDANQRTAPHVPVLLAEVAAALAPLAEARIVDATFGAGGYSQALLAAGARVVALDRDPSVAVYAEALGADYPERFSFKLGSFSELEQLVSSPVDAIVLDIGVSSMQLDQAERGFSFLRDGPLDMRMTGSGRTAADLVNGLDEEALAALFFVYGEERRSRRIAAAIARARAAAPIATTTALAAIIEASVGRRPGDHHPATRSFQALRIAVNDEFGELVAALFAAERALAEGGRLAVVTFHSLEDRIVKRFFSAEAKAPPRSRHLPQTADIGPARWLEVARAVRPSAGEVAGNPRARSALLRSARRSAAAARPTDGAGLGVPNLAGAA